MTAEQLLAKLPNLPAPPPSVARLLHLLASPEPDADEVVKVINADGVMSAKLLGLCNSAAYGLRSPVNSIDHAVMVLGHGLIHKLVLSAGFSGALSPALRGYAISDSELWRHSLLTALVAAEVCEAARAPGHEPSVAYTAGLLHDIGKSVLTHALDEASQTAMRNLIEHHDCSLSEAEQRVIGCDHSEIGECLLRTWGLPPVLLEAVANHHNPGLVPTPQLSAIVHVADIIAHEAGSSPGWASYAMRTDENAAISLGLDQADIERLIIFTYDDVQKVEDLAAAI